MMLTKTSIKALIRCPLGDHARRQGLTLMSAKAKANNTIENKSGEGPLGRRDLVSHAGEKGEVEPVRNSSSV